MLGYCINIMRSRWRGKKWGKPEMTPDGCEGCQNPAPWDLSTTSTSSSVPLTNLSFLFIGPIKPIVALVIYCERKSWDIFIFQIGNFVNFLELKSTQEAPLPMRATFVSFLESVLTSIPFEMYTE